MFDRNEDKRKFRRLLKVEKHLTIQTIKTK